MELQAPKRMDQLQFFRFVAFFWIFCTHTQSTLGMYMPGVYPLNISATQGGVYFFFVLSGFLKGYSSYRKTVTLSAGAVWKNLWQKLKKIYPLYVAVYLFYLIGTDSFLADIDAGLMADAKARGIAFFEHLFLIQAWDKRYCIDYNYASWFLSVLMFLVLLDLPVTRLYAKWDTRTDAPRIFGGLTVAFLAAEFFLRLWTSGLEPYYNLVFPLCRIPEYVGGITLGYFVRSIYPVAAKTFRYKTLWTVLECVALAFLVYGELMTEEFWGILLLHWMLPIFCLILVFSFGAGYVSSLLRLPPLPLLGNLVFPCYIMHPLIIEVVISRYTTGTATPMGMNVLFVYTILLLLILSYIVTYVLPGKRQKEI